MNNSKKANSAYTVFPVFLIICAGLVFSSCSLIHMDDVTDPAVQQTENGLPVFYIHPLPKVTEYAAATLYYRGVEYQVQAKTRGESSLWYPMKSITIQFPEDQLFSDAACGFSNKRKIILITSFDDNSCIRQRLAFDMWNRMAPENIQVRTYSAVVYGNGKYHGLYTCCDHIDADLMLENGLTESGNLFKTVSWDADFTIKSDQHKGFEKKEGLPEHGQAGAFADLDELIYFVDKTPSFAAGIVSRVNINEFMDSWILLSLLHARDSQVKNLYYYHNPGERWKILPWDFNCSFGQNSQTKRTSFSINDTFTDNRIFGQLTGTPELFAHMTDRLIDHIETGSLQLSWINSRIDEYYSEISAAAVKNEQKWKNKYRNFWIWDDRNDFTDFETEIAYIRNWISSRYSFLKGLYGE